MIRDIVRVNVSRQTRPVSSAGFGVPLLLSLRYDATTANQGTVLPFTDDVKVYTPTSGFVNELGTEGAKEAAFLNRLFGQALVPTRCLVGFKRSDETVDQALTRINNANSGFYVVCPILSDTSYLNSGGTNQTQGLKDLLAVNDWVSAQTKMVIYQDYEANALTGAGAFIDVTPSPQGDFTDLDFTDGDNNRLSGFRGVSKKIGSFGPVGTFPTELGDDIDIITNKFIGFSTVTAKRVDKIEYTEGGTKKEVTVNRIALNRKIKPGAQEPEIIVQLYATGQTLPATGDWSDLRVVFTDGTIVPVETLGSELKARAADRAAVFWTQNQGDYINAAIVGRGFPADPGTITFAYKSLNGVPVSRLVTPTATGYLSQNNVNYYTTIGGQNVIVGGQTASGEFIDITRGIDWLASRIQENVFFYLTSSGKIPYTDAGADVLVNATNEVLDQAVLRNVIDTDFNISKQSVRDIPANDRANRVFPDINITVRAAGAIHTVQYNLVVTV